MKEIKIDVDGTEVTATIELATPADLVVALNKPFPGIYCQSHNPYFAMQFTRFVKNGELTDFAYKVIETFVSRTVRHCRLASVKSQAIRKRVEELDTGSWFRPVELDTGTQPFLKEPVEDPLEAEIAALRDGIEWPDLHSGSAQRQAIEEFIDESTSYDEETSLVAIAFANSGGNPHEA